MLAIKKIYNCFHKAALDTVDHDGIEHAGYLAFVALLSFFPFLVFFFAIVAFFGQSELGLKFASIIMQSDVIPPSVLPTLETRIKEIISGPPQGLLTLAIIGAIWTASSTLDGLRTILNRAYRVSTPPAYILRRLMSIAEFIILTAILIAVTLLLVVTPHIWESAQHLLHIENLNIYITQQGVYSSPAWEYVRYIITTLLLFFVVVAAYIILPNTKQTIRSVSAGAAVVIFLWFISGYLLSFYLQDLPQVSILYGSLGGIIAALLFFYFTALIFIFGAELNYALEKARGHKIEEKERSKGKKTTAN